MSDASSNYSAVVEDILKLVWSAEEAGRDGVKPKDVSEHMGVVPSTATENIQRLARQGLVTHERYGRVRLTPQGRALSRSVPIEPMQVFRHALQTLTPAESRTLLRLLSKLEAEVRDALHIGAAAADEGDDGARAAGRPGRKTKEGE